MRINGKYCTQAYFDYVKNLPNIDKVVWMSKEEENDKKDILRELLEHQEQKI